MTKSNILNFAKTVTLAMIIAVGVSYTFAAWTTPPSSPPSNNTAAPLNTSANSQYKVGALGVGGLLKAYLGIDANDQIISNVATPVDGKDAVNKDYVDAAIARAIAGSGGSSSNLIACLYINSSVGERCFYLDGKICDSAGCRTPSGWTLSGNGISCTAAGDGRCVNSSGKVCDYQPGWSRWRCVVPTL